ncbi:MAG: TlpA family protein disulfide reductase [Candidatus Longimicrobiales bacterium M2_2A_002]
MSRARRVTLGVLASGLFTALLGYGMTRDAREIPSPLVGQPAPSFELETLESPGDSLALSELRGTAVVVNFWAS